MRTRDDAAAADTLGTYLLVGLTVLVATGFATLVFANLQVAPAPPHATFQVDAAAGSANVGVTHAGGEPWAFADARFTVTVNDSGATVASVAKSGDAARWSPGERVTLTLATPVPAGATVSVGVTAAGAGPVGSAARTLGDAWSGTQGAAPRIVNASASPASAPADGATGVTVTAVVDAPGGLLLVRDVTVDLRALGLGNLTLSDDGTLGDAVPLDGSYARTFEVPSGAPAANHTFRVTVHGPDGTSGASDVALEVVAASGGTGTSTEGTLTVATKVTTGIAFSGLPSSVNVTKFALDNITWDHAVPGYLQNDIAILKVTDPQNHSWTAQVLFMDSSDRLAVKTIDVYSAKGGCSWSPNGYLVTAPLNLLDPSQGGALGPGSESSSTLPAGLPPGGCALTASGVIGASYANAEVTEPTTLTVLRLGDNTGADEKTALIHTDVIYG